MAATINATVKDANAFVPWDGSSDILPAAGSNIRLWSQDNWGEDLTFNVRDEAP